MGNQSEEEEEAGAGPQRSLIISDADALYVTSNDD